MIQSCRTHKLATFSRSAEQYATLVSEALYLHGSTCEACDLFLGHVVGGSEVGKLGRQIRVEYPAIVGVNAERVPATSGSCGQIGAGQKGEQSPSTSQDRAACVLSCSALTSSAAHFPRRGGKRRLWTCRELEPTHKHSTKTNNQDNTRQRCLGAYVPAQPHSLFLCLQHLTRTVGKTNNKTDNGPKIVCQRQRQRQSTSQTHPAVIQPRTVGCSP